MDFPEGRGATPRIRNIGSGLDELGHFVDLDIIHPAGYIGSNQKLASFGNYNGINYRYLNGSFKRPQSELALVFIKLLSNFKLVWKYLTNRKPDIIWFYSYSLIDTGLLFFFAKIYGTKTVIDVCDERFDIHAIEHSKSLFRRINGWQGKISDIAYFKWVDGFAVVSSYLKSKIELLYSGQPIILLPLVANILEHDENWESDVSKSGAYLGSFTADEGLEFLIGVMSEIKVRHPDFKCVLYGAANSPEYENKLRDIVKKENLESSIIFGGMLPFAEIVPALRQHRLVLLPRLDSVISKAGFPGKLSEYLSSNRPIVATPFGDINKYFKNNESAFIASSFTKEDYLKCLLSALESVEISTSVALNAHRIGKNKFHYTSVAVQIENFIIALSEKKG